MYAYGSANPFPSSTFNATNYWVDVVFAPNAALAFTVPAAITGTAQESAVLSAVNGTTNDPNAVISGYQWQGSGDGGTTWASIAGATAATYTPLEADETHLLRVVETASDAGTGQNASSASAASAAVADIVLAFTSPASISGSATIGAVLTAGNGTLNDADAAVSGYQWQSSSDGGTTWANIAGATAAIYTPAAADQGHVLRVVETATDADGGPSTTSDSPATAAVTNNTLVFTTPAAITGTAQEGAVLSAVNGTTNDPSAVISGYQWQSSGDGGTTWSNVAGATAATYTPLEADETHLLRVVETATDSASAQSGSSASAASAAVADIVLAFTSPASISGSATIGAVLTAGNGTLNDADAAVSGYQWQSSSDGGTTWANIAGAAAATYTPAAADQGHVLRVVETATDADGGPSTTSDSPATAAVGVEPASLFGPGATPGTITENDPQAVDLGVKFQASTSGEITGIRFYKGPQNTGTHIGDLWSSSGTLLASATFTNETASGWQQVNFSSPVSITAGTTYIASYEAPVGEYSADANYFANALTNGPLTAPSSAASGGNGVYAYGSANPFPSSTFNATNYWVDVVFAPNAALAFTVPAAITGTAQESAVLSAVNGTTNDPNAVISGYQWQGSGDGGTTWASIAGATAATYTPLEADETHLLRVVETASDAGTGQNASSASAASAAVADIVLAFTSPASISGSATIGAVLTAGNGTLNDADAAVSGYQWQSSSDGGTTWANIAGATAAIYTPAAADQGHVLRVVETAADADGGPSTTSDSPATAAVTNNTLVFTTPAAITGTAQEGAVLSAVNGTTNDPSAVISGYQWQSSGDGGTTWSNVAGATAATYTPLEADETHLLRVVETATDSASAQSGSSASAASAAVADIVLAFTSPASISGSATIGAVLTAGNGTLNDADAAVSGYQWQSSSDGGTTWANIAGAAAATYTPAAADQGHVLRVVETATDADGGPSTTSDSPATAAVGVEPASLFGPGATPGTITENDPQAVDLGVKFQASTSGEITGIRFYKGPQNTGTHIGDLWSSSGTLLASATFTNETASGWQQVNFSSPVSITAGTTYIASYEAPVGEYSADANYFANALTNGPLTAPSSAASGGNGVYAYGSANPFPSSTFNATNYWVDVVFAPNAALAFTVPAAITGTAQESAVLSAVNGTTNDPNAVISGYQWQGSGDGGTTWASIAGATAATYTPLEADETHLLRVVETASDAGTGQNASSASAASAAVADIVLAFTSPASISGSATIGAVLTAGNGTLNDADAAVSGYQWQSSSDGGTTWANIAGATAATYTPAAADQGHVLRVVETATDADGGPSTTSDSPATAAVTNNTLVFTTPAAITGTAQEGAVLSAVNGTTNDPSAVISGYQWQSSGDGGTTWSNVAGATAATYTPLEADETHLLRVVETATDSASAQSGSSASAASAAVADIVLAFTSPASISGSATIGAVLTAGNGTLNDADAAVSGYQWQSSSDGGTTWANIAGAAAATYTPAAADQGHVLRVVETATDADGGPSTTSDSPATAAVAAGAPTGFTFAPATSSLQALQGGSNLAARTPVGTFTQTGGTAGDSFTYTLSGTTAFTLNSGSNQGNLSTGASAVAGNTVAGLSVQVNDTTNGTSSGPLPIDIVVGSSSANTINLSTLGIAPSTPTLVYGLAGNDTINASGMGGQMWFIGGAAADTITGGTGANTYLYAAASNSTPSAFDVITNFNPALDKIDLTGIGTAALSFLAAQVSTNIPARSIGWEQSGGNTFVYVNTSTLPKSLGAASMEIELNHTVSLAATNFLHH